MEIFPGQRAGWFKLQVQLHSVLCELSYFAAQSVKTSHYSLEAAVEMHRPMQPPQLLVGASLVTVVVPSLVPATSTCPPARGPLQLCDCQDLLFCARCLL